MQYISQPGLVRPHIELVVWSLLLADNISEERMAEGEDKDTTGEDGVRGAPVSAGPCSLLAWPLGNLASLLIGVPQLPEGTQFRWNIRFNKSTIVRSPSLFWQIPSSGHLLPNPLVDHLII